MQRNFLNLGGGGKGVSLVFTVGHSEILHKKQCLNINKIKLNLALLSHLQAALILSFLQQNNIWTLEVKKPNI